MFQSYLRLRGRNKAEIKEERKRGVRYFYKQSIKDQSIHQIGSIPSAKEATRIDPP